MNTIFRLKKVFIHFLATLWLCFTMSNAAATTESHQLTINNLNVQFQTDGLKITAPENAWYCHLTVTGYGYGPNIQPVSEAKRNVTGNRTEYQYGNLTEWYLNDNNGLEQGITLQAPPQPRTAAPLTVKMALNTNLFPLLTENHQAIVFKDKAGKTALNYDKLYVFDANHQKMPAHLTLTDNTLAVVVDDSQATYPLTIDPMMINGETIIDRMNASAGDFFGQSISIDGNIAIIGASGTHQARGAAYVFELIETTWQQTQTLIPDDGDWLESFGKSVAIQGDLIVIGSPVHNEMGAAYVYKYINNTWQLKTKLTPNDGAVGDEFGDMVAIDQNRIVISAHEHAQGKGAVYIFERVGNLWQQTEKLMVNIPDIGEGFGDTFAISNNTIAIHNGNGTGSVHIFTYSNGSWSQQVKLISNNAHELFGDAISLYENTIAINESVYYGDDNHSGFVYIFERSGTEWIEQQRLIANDPEINDRFGYSVSLHGNTLVIGARRDDDRGEESGSAYIFQKSNEVWLQTAKITAADGTAGDQFGGSISTDGNTIIVGAYHNSDNGTDSGATYLFNRSDFDNWTQTKITANNDIGSGDDLGFSVVTSGDNVVIGAPFDDDKNSNSGSAYVFNHVKGNWQQIMKLIFDGSGFGFSVAMDQNIIAVGSPSTKQNNSKGVVSVFRQVDNIWSLEQILSGLDGDIWFGASTAISGNTVVVGVAYNQEFLNAIYIFEYINGIWEQQEVFQFNSDYLLFPISIDENILVVGLPKKNMIYIFEQVDNSWSLSPIELRVANLDATAEFGYSVSNSGNTIAVGAPNDGKSGSVYLFERSDKEWLQLAKFIPNDGGEGDKFGQSISLHGNALVVGASLNDEKGENSGAAYLFRQTLSGWKKIDKLTASNPEKGDNFGFSVSLDDNTVIVGTPNKNVGGKDKSGAAYVYNYSFINDAPILNNDGDMLFPSIDEDIPNDLNSGMLISELIASAGEDRITDLDTGAVEGIAVIAADDSNGTWQYSLDNGINWANIGPVSDNTSRLLASDENTRLRFKPNSDFNGTAQITFRAWDQSDERHNGDLADTTTVGDPTAFSVDTETASITVDSVTDAPMIAPIPQQNVKLGETLNLQITATDPHDNPANFFNFSLSGELASEAIINTINGEYGEFSWTASRFGIFTVNVTVIETNGSPYNLSHTRTFTIAVENSPPELKPIGDKTVMLNDIFKFTARATDPENNTLAFSLAEAPKGAMINPLTGEFTWTPATTGHFQTTIVVTDDGGKTDQETITITVSADPILAIIPDQFLIYGQRLILNANARHPTDDPIMFTLTTGPNEAVLDSETGELRWNPEAVDSYNMTITVTELFTNRSVDKSFIIDVEPAKTSLRFWLDQSAIFKDSGEVNLSGQLTSYPDVKEHLTDLDIELTIRDPNGYPFLTETTQTQEDGKFAFSHLTNFSEEGDYTFKVSFAGTNNLEAARPQSDFLQVKKLAGYAILIQGRIKGDDEGLKTHNKSLNRVYRRLIAREFKDENIEYLNYDMNQSGITVDGIPTKDRIGEAFVETRNRMNKNPGPLYIVMIDHGGVDGSFYIENEVDEVDAEETEDNDNAKYRILPTDLDGWLDKLEAGLSPLAKQQERVSIIGSCYSGSYIPTLSAPGRVIVTSTTETEESYKGPTEPDKIRSGEFFIEALFAEFGKGKSLKTAFEIATQYTEMLTRIGGADAPFYPQFEDGSAQHPLLDDDGNGEGSNVFWSDSQEGFKAKDIYLGLGPNYNLNPLNFNPYHPNNPLMILAVTPTRYLSATQSEIQLFADVNHLNKVAGGEIVVNIRAPSVTLSTDGTEQTGQLRIGGRRITLTADSNGRFTGNFNDFTEPGQYEILYFANDSETGEMVLQRSIVYKKTKDENQPPRMFDLLYPEHESETTTNVIFDWSNALDPEGDFVTYTLSIATDPNFQQEVYRQEGLTFSMSYVDENTVIDEGVAGTRLGLRDDTEYFWRVQAIDYYGNVTHSTPSYFSFKTDNKNVPPSVSDATLTGDEFDAQLSENALQTDPNDPNPVYKDCQGICRVVFKALTKVTLMMQGFRETTISESGNYRLRRKNPIAQKGTIQFSVDSLRVAEDRGKVNILVKRVGGSDGYISVQYTTLDDSATAEHDYTLVPGELTWKDQETLSKRITLEIQDDSYFEGDETLVLSLFNQSAESVLGSPNQITIIIEDNEEPSALEPETTEDSDDDGDSEPPRKDKDSDDGSDKLAKNGANDGTDAEPKEDSETVSPSESEVVVIQKPVDETATPSTTADTSSVMTVSDDEHQKTQHTPSPSQEGNQTAASPPLGVCSEVVSPLLRGDLGVCEFSSLQFSKRTYAASENQGTVEITVIRTNSKADKVSVKYQAIDGTAKTGEDYQLEPGTLTWADGEDGEKAFEITIVNNNQAEPHETLMLGLSEVTGYAELGEISHTILTISDDEITCKPLICPKPSLSQETVQCPSVNDAQVDEIPINKVGPDVANGESEILSDNTMDSDDTFCLPMTVTASQDKTENQCQVINNWYNDNCIEALPQSSCPDSENKDEESDINLPGLEQATFQYLVQLPDLGDDKAIDRFGNLMDNPSHAEFAGGISVDMRHYQRQDNLQLSDWLNMTGKLIEITGKITVDPIHIGEQSEILVVAGYIPPSEEAVTAYYMQNAEKAWFLWDDDMENLLPFQSVDRLHKTHFVKLFTGDSLPNMPGKFRLYFGYHLLEDGLIIFNGEQQIEVEIEKE